MIKLFAVVNGTILEDLGENLTPTSTRIHYLLKELQNLKEVEVRFIPYKQIFGQGIMNIIFNNIIKTIVFIYTFLFLITTKPKVYFAYPHSITNIQGLILFKLAKLFKFDIILDVQDTIEQGQAIGKTKGVFNEAIEEYCLKNAKLILALNKQMLEHLKEKYRLGEAIRTAIINNAYEEEMLEFYPDSYKSVGIRFNICYIGAITINRGVDILINACKNLHESYSFLKLHLFAPKKTIDEGLFGEIEHCKFIIIQEIPRKEIPIALKEMDLLVMPYNPNIGYLNSSSPTKFFEYIGTAKPILCTRCESLLDIGKNDSILYIEYDQSEFEKNIEYLIINPAIREKMSKKLMGIRSNHTWKERAKLFNEAIKYI